MEDEDILANAPENATHVDAAENYYVNDVCDWELIDARKGNALIYQDISISNFESMHSLSDIRELVELRKEVERIEELEKQKAVLVKERDDFKSLALLITTDVIDLIRCGIGGNYGGTLYQKKMNKTHAPILKALNSIKPSLQAHNLEQQAKGIENFCSTLWGYQDVYPASGNYVTSLAKHRDDFLSKLRNQTKEVS